jgi:hypothetical protein
MDGPWILTWDGCIRDENVVYISSVVGCWLYITMFVVSNKDLMKQQVVAGRGY